MISNQQTTSKNSFISFPFGEISKEFSYGATVLMGHHLFVFAHGPEDSKRRVINLKDNSVQTCWGFSFGDVNDNYSLTKYGENQIIKFGGETDKKASNELVLITISSFEPLIMRSEIIQDDDSPKLSGHTTTIYQDCLYVFGGRNRGTDKSSKKELWCYDLKIGRWKLCETIGRGPKPREGAKSWIRDDKLYIYGGFSRNSKTRVSYSELFELNLKSKKWRKIQPKGLQPGQDSTFFGRFSTDVYQDNLLILKNEAKDESDKLYFCNQSDLSDWSMLDVKGLEEMKTLGNSAIYRNVLYMCGTKNNRIFLATLQLDDFAVLKSFEEDDFSSLFMNEKESDVKFKIKDEIIPAHKKVLAQKSQYFANVFNSSPDQQVIEIDSRKENTFKRFLQFLYCGTIDANLAKFLLISENYAQEEDLQLKCVNILAQSLTLDNVCSVFDFACERDITLLKDWCIKFIKSHMGFENIIKWSGFLTDQIKNREWTEIAVDFLLKDLFKLMAGDKEVLGLYEDFMVKSVSMQNVVKLSEYYLHFQVKMPNLKEAMLNFVDTNLDSLQEQGLYKRFSFHFDLAFSAYQKKLQESSIPIREYSTDAESTSQMSHRDQKDRVQRKGIKRMEPSSNFCEEEG